LEEVELLNSEYYSAAGYDDDDDDGSFTNNLVGVALLLQ